MHHSLSLEAKKKKQQQKQKQRLGDFLSRTKRWTLIPDHIRLERLTLLGDRYATSLLL